MGVTFTRPRYWLIDYELFGRSVRNRIGGGRRATAAFPIAVIATDCNLTFVRAGRRKFELGYEMGYVALGIDSNAFPLKVL